MESAPRGRGRGARADEARRARGHREAARGPRRLRGRARSPTRGWRDARRRRPSSSRGAGSSSRCARSRTTAELDTIRRAAAVTNAAFEPSPRSASSGGRSATSRGGSRSCSASTAARASRSRRSSPRGPNGAHAARRRRATARSSRATPSSSTRAPSVGGYASDCTRTFAAGELADELAEAYDVCLRGQLAAVEAMRRGRRPASTPTPPRATRSPRRASASTSATGSATASGCDVHEAPRLSRESEDTLVARNVVTIEPGSTCRAAAGSGSRTSRSSPTTASRC